MNQLTFDPFEAASAVAAEGEEARALGETDVARTKFLEAGDILKENVGLARKLSEKNEQLFLAASQYYHGGDYKAAKKLCGKIQERLLNPGSRPIYARFLVAVHERSAPGYIQSIRDRVMDLYGHKQFAEILEVLKWHQYVFTPGAMAHIRGTCCEALQDYRAAAIFFSDAARFENYPDGFVFLDAMAPLKLQGTGQMSESWDYMGHFLRLYPHPIMSFTASLMCFNRAVKLTGQEQIEHFRLQIELFERADSQLGETPLSPTSDKDVRGLMGLGLQAAAITFARLGDLDRAKDVADRAISVDPQSRFPRELRELLNFQEGVITREGRPTTAADAIIEEQWKRFQSKSVKASHPLAL